VSTNPLVSQRGSKGGGGVPVEDIRAARPYILARSILRSGVRRLGSIVALACIDVAGLVLGVYGALVLRAFLFEPKPVLWGVLWRDGAARWLPFLVLITILVFWRSGLYAPRELREGPGRILSSLVLVTVLAAAFGIGTGHDFGTYGIFPTALALTAVAIALLRWSYESITGNLLRVAGVRRRALLVGDSAQVAHLREALGAGRAGIRYEFVGAVAPGAAGGELRVLGDFDALSRVLAGTELDELIVSGEGISEERLLEVVEQAHRRGVRVRIAPKATQLLVDRAEYVPGQGVPLFELRPPAFAGADWALKRGFDLLVGSAIVLVGLPLWLLIAAAIKLTSRGPVLYGDRRVGLGEQEFRMLKFRTMVAGADRLQSGLEQANEATGALFKIRDDPRVTRVGRLLRRFSLDEVPNVINVLRGEMSLVGPRPLPLRDYEKLEPWHRKRYLVLPGMTGLWQIAGRSELSFDDLVRLDFYYTDNWSIWLDVAILLKTPGAVLTRRGAY
jgi:exopolysaccharide biosynthesis polyprenyl glycosylphosphotransferase